MANWKLADPVIVSYIKNFYGHGSYQAKYWFIGMEFGGGSSPEEIEDRIQGWYDRGSKELEDVVNPDGTGGGPWFRGEIPLQPTWAKLIRVILSAEGQAPQTEDIRTYQRNRLGRVGGLDCLLELFPLPSPGLNQWKFYPQYSQLPYLRERAAYTRHVGPLRVAHLRQRIAEHRPANVIFYGEGYTPWWNQIAGVDFQFDPVEKVAIVMNGPTRYVVMYHPQRIRNNTYFDAVGRLIGAGPPG
jgi:hypothetical protein